VEPVAEALIADLFFDLLDAAEFDAGGTFALFAWQFSADIFFDQQIEMGADFLVEIVVNMARRNQIAKEAASFGEELHIASLLFVAKGDKGVDLSGTMGGDGCGNE
jgi:hypothetical protein